MIDRAEIIGKMVLVQVNWKQQTWIGPVSYVGKDKEGSFVDTPTGRYWHDIIDVKDSSNDA